jgi:soluble lytic murein transglycosylase
MNSLGMQRDATPRMRRLLGRLPSQEISKLTKPVMRLFYPMPYLAETKPLLAHDTLLDAAFVHAVMRQESGYDRFAKSGAGAMGLLQLMPATARAMARVAGVGGFRTEQLNDPVVNLRLGITYLRDLTRVWKGQLPLVLANYNAGPSATMRWMDGFLKLPIEQATEEITYWETRDYVKKCMGNYWTYRLLYPESK